MNNQDITKTQGIRNPERQQREPIRKRLFTVREASVYIGRSVNALRELIWAGKLPIVRPDRKIFLDIQDLDKWIEQSKIRYTY